MCSGRGAALVAEESVEPLAVSAMAYDGAGWRESPPSVMRERQTATAAVAARAREAVVFAASRSFTVCSDCGTSPLSILESSARGNPGDG